MRVFKSPIISNLYIRSTIKNAQRNNLPGTINNDDSTASRPLCEVKHRLTWFVLRWGTTLEYQVLFFCCDVPFVHNIAPGLLWVWTARPFKITLDFSGNRAVPLK
jgi:hypothetical protein